MRALPDLTEHQQRLYCALALLEETTLKNFFRAIRSHPDSREEVELVNLELDRGLGLMDIFGPFGPLKGSKPRHTLEWKITWLRKGQWTMDFGFHGPAGHGTCWSMVISPEGEIQRLQADRIWRPWRKRKSLLRRA